MKIKPAAQGGSVLMIILVAIILIGFTLGSYLSLVAHQNRSVVHSQTWNAAIPVAEAGIEEAMAHLNYNTTNRTRDGWAIDGTNLVKERTVGREKYRVMISKDLEPPVIVSEGHSLLPKGDAYLIRTVAVTTTNDALFAKGLVAKGQIDLSGNSIRTDSFDSTDPNKSTGGRYDPAKAGDDGDVATNSALIDSLNVWNAEIYGEASTGPGGTVSIGPNGSIGEKWWHDSGHKGIQPGMAKDDMNVYFPDVKPPFSGGAFVPAPGTVSGTNYNYVVGEGNHVLPALGLSGSEKVIVTGHAVLYVLGNISLTGNSFIYIAPGSSLQLFVAGEQGNLGGNGVVNGTGRASDFAYYGLNSNKEVRLTGNATFVGTVYAPHASLTMGGGGKDIYDFAGATVSDTVKMNGHFRFHYDESLRKFGPRRGYTITSWNEMGWVEL